MTKKPSLVEPSVESTNTNSSATTQIDFTKFLESLKAEKQHYIQQIMEADKDIKELNLQVESLRVKIEQLKGAVFAIDQIITAYGNESTPKENVSKT